MPRNGRFCVASLRQLSSGVEAVTATAMSEATLLPHSEVAVAAAPLTTAISSAAPAQSLISHGQGPHHLSACQKGHAVSGLTDKRLSALSHWRTFTPALPARGFSTQASGGQQTGPVSESSGAAQPPEAAQAAKQKQQSEQQQQQDGWDDEAEQPPVPLDANVTPPGAFFVTAGAALSALLAVGVAALGVVGTFYAGYAISQVAKELRAAPGTGGEAGSGAGAAGSSTSSSSGGAGQDDARDQTVAAAAGGAGGDAAARTATGLEKAAPSTSAAAPPSSVSEETQGGQADQAAGAAATAASPAAATGPAEDPPVRRSWWGRLGRLWGRRKPKQVEREQEQPPLEAAPASS